jgi:GAF domain-containing protein
MEERHGHTADNSADPVFGLIEAALDTEQIEGLGEGALPLLTELAQAKSAFLYISDPRLPSPCYGDMGFPPAQSCVVEEACSEWFDRMVERMQSAAATMSVIARESLDDSFVLHPLVIGDRVLGMVGTPTNSNAPSAVSNIWGQLLAILARVADHLTARVSTERKLLHLNTYLTVSSMLAKSVDLEELLEIALCCSMEAVSAEAASILLLDEEKKNFQFYRVEGPAKPLLGGSSFPATEGVAGRVLQTLEAEIVEDARNDSQFYGQIDRQTGFQTRNMIAVPLVAGDEQVGVLEVLNKEDDASFTPDERLILLSVADEIAFAIRNATLFDYVVNTYCKRRQGNRSCKGCSRPLGSWTPCMRYREFLP